MHVPENAPDACPVCDREYDSVSEHDAGVMVNLLDNDLYRRVCFQPRPGNRLWFYHHTHEQTGDVVGDGAATGEGTAGTDDPTSAAGRSAGGEDPAGGETVDD